MTVLICTHERVWVTQKNIDWLLSHGVEVIVVRSSDAEHFKGNSSLHVLTCDNRPLGFKWQYGVSYAEMLGAAPLVICGSDDFLSDGYFSLVENYLKMGIDFIGLTSWITYDEKRKEAYHCQYSGFNKNFPIGSGKVFSRELLDRMKWKLFENHLERKLDDLSFYSARDSGARIHLVRSPEVLAYKGSWPALNNTQSYLTSKNITTMKVGTNVLNSFGCAG